VFSPAADAFVLNGNPITLGGNITNNSSSPQTINLGLNFSSNCSFSGAAGPLILADGLTNRAGTTGPTTLSLSGSGQLVNLLNSAVSPGGTNILLLNDAAASWTLLDNPALRSMTVPWVLEVNNGTFNFGTDASAPNLTTTTPNNTPSDNLVGSVSGATATFNMVNGTLTTSARFNTALSSSSTGIINQFGGTLNIGSQFQGANGSNPGEVSIVNVSGGTMNIGGGSGPFYVASRGTGTLTVGGSGVVNCGRLDLSRNAAGNTISSAGTVNLDGGTLMVTSVTNISANQQTGGRPTATFNFDGGTLLAKSGAAAGFFQGCTVTPVTPITAIVEDGGAVIDDGGNAITIAEPLQHDSTLGSDPDGGLTKLNTGTLTLTAASTYNGDTTVAAGTFALSGVGSIANSATIVVAGGATLDASPRSDTTLTLTSGQILTGSGTVKGNVIVGDGATLAPGGSLSTMTFNNNLTLNDGSTTVVEVSKSPTTNDAARVTGALTYGGTLVITNVSAGSFAAGDSFKLFTASSFTGVFTTIVPVIPAVNLAWNTNNLNAGTLSIVSSPTPRPGITGFSFSGGVVAFSATNGVPGWPCVVLASTNLALPLSQWTGIATNLFDSNGSLTFTAAPDSNLPGTFYTLELQ
jgi:fibronectin-binding autotransporter adhesin